MNKLDELIQKHCPDGVEYKELNKVCKFQNGFAFKSALFSESGLPILRITNILSDGKLSDDGYVYFNPNDYKENLNNYIVKPKNIVVAMSGATTGKIGYNYSKQEYYLNQRVGMFLPDESCLLNRYLYHWLLGQSKNILAISAGTGAQPNLSSVKMMMFKIPVPPLEVQREIVRILDNFTELTAELTARKKQYEYYRGKLIDEICSDGVEYKKLGEFCKIQTGRGITNKDTTDDGAYPVISGGVKPMGYYYEYNRNENTVTIARAGSAGYVNFIDRKFYLNDKCFSIIPNDMTDTRYLYHVLKQIEESIVEMKSAGSVPTVNIKKVSKICVPIPLPKEQKRIVSILDRFDSLCNDISSGIPSEIAARQKQYEYYRENLLDFKLKTKDF